MSRTALLDINVLVALFDPDHIHHEIAHDWFTDQSSAGWATCPLTENGFVRVLSSPAYGIGLRPLDLVDRLKRFCASGPHTFWPDAISLGDEKIFNPSFVRGHAQVTDIYLLGLARKMGGCLATFDQSIPLRAIHGAKPEHLLIISAVGIESR